MPRWVVVVSVVVVVVLDPLAPIVLALLPVSALGLAEVLGLAGVLALLPAAGLSPVLAPVLGVPVLPMGVDWLLCWPAPAAGSLEVVSGGVLCAIAEPASAMAAKPASTPLRGVDAVMETPFESWMKIAGITASCFQAISTTKSGRRHPP